VKELTTIIDDIRTKDNAQALERLRIKTTEMQAEALADGYLSGIHDAILMLQDYIKQDSIKDKPNRKFVVGREGS
jgi:phage shock protein A